MDIGRVTRWNFLTSRWRAKRSLAFPIPFFDPRDNRPLTLPMVFAGAPDLTEQQAAAVIASWFGSRTGWRAELPVMYNGLPDRNAIVFATNDNVRISCVITGVNAPTIEMMSHPNNPYVKLLVVFGRDDKDLLQAAKVLPRATCCSVAAASPLMK
jgi:hypothetical protein